MTSRRHKQRGVALITVMLVFVIVAVIATEMLRRSQLSLRSVGNLIETRQAYYYALGGEAFARQLLAQDIIDGHGNIDSLSEAWAQTKEQQPFDIGDGRMQIEINDLQGRFDLNSVTADAQGAPGGSGGLEQFKRLLTALQLNVKYATEWRDWINNRGTSATESTEKVDFGGSNNPAAQPEADISALRLLPSMQPQDYAKLAPHVTVLPKDSADGSAESGSRININTADDVVLQAIASPTLSAQIVGKQKTGGYRSPADAGLSEEVATVKSQFFEVVVTVNYAKRWQRIRTVLQRTGEKPNQVEFKVISRVRSPLIDDIELQSSDDNR